MLIPTIDAGNSRFKSAVADNAGNPKLITNRFGESFTPSAVYFNPDGTTIVGTEAINAGFIEGNRLVKNWKRAMGTDEVLYKADDGKQYKAMDVLAILLQDAKDNIEAKTGEVVNEAVITVPANYTELQIQQTKEAAKIAGIQEVIALPNEPTAAALGNGLHKNTNSTAIVYDLGGGTLDVSIVRSEGNIFTVINTGGDPNVGGRDFNDCICQNLLDEFEATHGFVPSEEDHSVFYQDMDQRVEQLKISLSVQQQSQIVLFCQGKQLQMMVTREMFNSWVEDLAVKTIEKTREVIEEADMAISDIDEIYAVGGGSKMPLVIEMLEELIGKKVSKKCEPHCAAAFGGILCGRMECQRLDKEYSVGGCVLPPPKEILHEILSHSIGVMTLDDNVERCTEILGKKTPIPSTQTKLFKLSEPNQTEVLIQILEGEDGKLGEDCLKLGHFKLNGLPARPDLIGRIEVTFSLDSSGVLTAKARDNASGKESQMQIDYDIKGKNQNAA